MIVLAYKRWMSERKKIPNRYHAGIEPKVTSGLFQRQ